MNRRSARNRHRPRPAHVEPVTRVVHHSPDHIERRTDYADFRGIHRSVAPPGMTDWRNAPPRDFLADAEAIIAKYRKESA